MPLFTTPDSFGSAVSEVNRCHGKAPGHPCHALTLVKGHLRTADKPEGYARSEMPQLKGEARSGTRADRHDDNPTGTGMADARQRFLKHLTKIGVSIDKKKITASKLRATQKELDSQRIAALVKKGGSQEKRIFVSRDNRVLDGHHHWAATMVTDPKVKQRVYKIDMDMKDLLPLTKRWTKKFGIKAKAA